MILARFVTDITAKYMMPDYVETGKFDAVSMDTPSRTINRKSEGNLVVCILLCMRTVRYISATKTQLSMSAGVRYVHVTIPDSLEVRTESDIRYPDKYERFASAAQ